MLVDTRTFMGNRVGIWTTATRPANPTAYQTLGYNTTIEAHEAWNGTAWVGFFDPITTEGDLVVGDATGQASRLGVGENDQVFTVVDGAPAWADAGGGGGINSIVEIIATDSAYDVSAILGFVRFTLVGGGGGGAYRNNPDGGAGGTTSIVSGGVTTSASGGLGGMSDQTGRAAQNAFVSYNSGQASVSTYGEGHAGLGGEIKTVYYNLSDVSTIDVTVGAGGSPAGRNGFRGVIVMEYSA
jgi:hypothetical protein